MVLKLRRKFVIVTTSLLVVVFSGFFLINSMYNSYFNMLDTIDTLEWISYSGVFTSENPGTIEEELAEDIDLKNPVIGIIADTDGTLLEMNIIGKKGVTQLPEKVFERIVERKSSGYKAGSYYYFYRPLPDGKGLYVIVNSTNTERTLSRIAAIAFISVCGVGMLVAITFHLSKYVTEPAEESLLREKRFISDASHELKTPLGAILVNAEALEMDIGDNGSLKNIISESKRMSRLIERLLTLSRYDEETECVKKEFDLSSVCRGMFLTYESMAFEKGIHYSEEIEDGIMYLGNEDEIRQLLAILIDNAIKHTEEKGNIKVRLYKDKKIIISVENSGRGIPDKDMKHLFDRFYTADSSRSNRSHGLGLAIGKAIVERHGGSLQAESKTDEYARFTARL